MEVLMPLLADGTRVGFVLVSMLAGLEIVRTAYTDATDRYKLTADEESQRADAAETRVTALEQKLSQTVDRLDDALIQLGRCRAETSMAKFREDTLAARIDQLEDRLAALTNPEGDTTS